MRIGFAPIALPMVRTAVGFEFVEQYPSKIEFYRTEYHIVPSIPLPEKVCRDKRLEW